MKDLLKSLKKDGVIILDPELGGGSPLVVTEATESRRYRPPVSQILAFLALGESLGEIAESLSVEEQVLKDLLNVLSDYFNESLA